MDSLTRLAVACLASPDVGATEALHMSRDLGLPPWLTLRLARNGDGNGRPVGRTNGHGDGYGRGNGAGRPNLRAGHDRGRPWGDQEIAFLKEHFGYMELAELARALNRTANAIKIKAARCGLSIRKARPRAGIYNARQAAGLLGIACSKTVARLIDEGHLAAEIAGNDPLRPIYRIERAELEAFLARPVAGIVVDPDAIRDPGLRAAYHRAGHPAFLTTRQAAARLDLATHTLSARARQGLVPALRWGNWWFREEDIPAIRRTLARNRRRPPRTMRRFTPEEDRVLVTAAALGYNTAEIGDVLDRPPGSLTGRLVLLQKQEDFLAPVQDGAARSGRPILCRPRAEGKPAALLGRPDALTEAAPGHAEQFPVAAAIAALRRGGRIDAAHWPHLRAWLRAWFLFWLEDLPAIDEAGSDLAADLSLAWHHLRYRLPNDATLGAEIRRALYLLNLVGLDPLDCRWHARWEPYRRAGRTIPAADLVCCPIDEDTPVVTLARALEKGQSHE